MNIAVVDDDSLLAELLCLWLTEAGFQCTAFNSGQDFIAGFNRAQIDVVLLDMVMPDMNGEAVLDWLRNQPGDPIPVIFVTSCDMEEDMIRMLNQGADDYITKPVGREQLLARINAVTRRVYKYVDNPVLEIGPYRIDAQSHSVTCNGEQVKLTEKEFELVLYLFSNLGRLLPRQKILSTVWGYEADVNTRTVDTHISRIRKKLHISPENGWRLSSIYHQGYRLEQLAASTQDALSRQENVD